ncbi:hypothetical protein OsJ_15016 [Oryza sativa Japonica Group]|uniref:OSJNBa0006M15.12 protein n=2 Tax=Oryza sativa TaxID=4530 RepID=Q7X8R7_ORYSJ|nr:hypothetical protein OsJ_15016 [Oryza sativa Japonica Group]CAE02569.2 OSJNBa0006M15.12 [Oryza sativa Japonica Group]CAH67013.1 H0523F07.1 [Oryza sativa]
MEWGLHPGGAPADGGGTAGRVLRLRQPRADGVHVVAVPGRAGRVTRAVGRQAVMLAGAALFFAGAAVNAAAVNIAMLIVDSMLLGFGIGFTNLQVAVAWIMGSQIGRDGESAMARRYSVAVLALTCVFSAAFGWSWGPLTWC